MKKILLVNLDQNFIGDFQTKFAHHYDVLATENHKAAYELCKTLEIDLLLARLPPKNLQHHQKELKKLLKKLNNQKFAYLTKVLTTTEDGDYQFDDYMKYGIAAILMNVNEIEKWLT